MNHHDATGLLVEFADGTLDRVTSREMTSHVETCDECREWLHTYALLSRTPAAPNHSNHPESLGLAACAVRPEEEFEPDHPDLRSHLSTCESCREDLERVRHAVVHARPGADAHTAHPFTPARATTWWWTAAAAAGLLGLAIGAIIGSGFFAVTPTATTSDDREAVATADIAPNVPTVSPTSIDGERLIRSEEPLTIVNTSVSPGASVTIQARRGVAFGNGFQVGSGTRIEVGALPEHDTIQHRKGGPNERG